MIHKNMVNVDANALCYNGTDLILYKKTLLILPKSSLKLISSTCSSFWLKSYLISLIDVFCHQTVGIPMGIKCSFLVWGRLHTGTSKNKQNKLARCFIFTFLYIDDVLPVNNSWFGDFVDRFYPIELEMEDTTYTDRSSSHLHISYTNIIYFPAK